MTKIIIKNDIIELEKKDDYLKIDLLKLFLDIPIIFYEIFNLDFENEFKEYLRMLINNDND